MTKNIVSKICSLLEQNLLPLKIIFISQPFNVKPTSPTVGCWMSVNGKMPFFYDPFLQKFDSQPIFFLTKSLLLYQSIPSRVNEFISCFLFFSFSFFYVFSSFIVFKPYSDFFRLIFFFSIFLCKNTIFCSVFVKIGSFAKLRKVSKSSSKAKTM